MIYTKTILAPFGGDLSSPTVVDFPLTVGLIYQFDVFFPPGSAGLLKVRVNDGGAPLWPSEPTEWFYGDNLTISFPDRYFISSAEPMLRVWYYNEDDTYDHSFTVRVGQVSADIFIASFLPSVGFESMTEAIQGLQKGQVEEVSARQALIDKYFGR